jgi:uncharacterized protein (UPF0212 family)
VRRVIASRGDVVNGSSVFYAKRAGHAKTIAKKEQNAKIKYLTLIWFDIIFVRL